MIWTGFAAAALMSVTLWMVVQLPSEAIGNGYADNPQGGDAAYAKILDGIIIASLFGVFPWEIAVSLIVSNYIFKVFIEVVITPATYGVVHFLKCAEHEDYYETQTNFNPFRWKVRSA